MPLVLTILAVVTAALTIVSKARESKRGEYVFKPLTTVLILAIALLADNPISSTYRALIVAGLVASLAGDVFLMLPDRFTPGLLSFLIAHIFYILAFTHESSGMAPIWYIIPFVLYGVVILRWLWPHLGSVRVPVMIYMGAILIMAYQAANRWIETAQDGTLLALAGAYLFVASDSALAVNMFRGRFRGADFIVLSTYFAAQLLIAWSVYGR